MSGVETSAAPVLPGELELHFSPRELVKSVLRTGAGDCWETGVKGAEVRWQQGAIAVCVLAVWTRLRALEGAANPPVLEGERGSPARSLDNLLNKPGDWALQMFGEQRGQPAIRDFIYRKRTVSRSNSLSAVQWETRQVPAAAIRIWRAGEELTSAVALRELLRVLLEEFNPRRAVREWEALCPPVEAVEAAPEMSPLPSPKDSPEEPAPEEPTPEDEGESEEASGGEAAAGESPSAKSAPKPAPASVPAPESEASELVDLPPVEAPSAPVREQRPPPPPASPSAAKARRWPWVAGALVGCVLLLGLGVVVGRWTAPGKVVAENAAPLASAILVEQFIERLNAGNLEAAYALTTPRFQETMPVEAFAVAYGEQRYNFPRLAGNPYRNGPDATAHDYRVALYVETRVHRIPPLDNLARIPLTEFDEYAKRVTALKELLSAAGVDAGLLNQLRKDRLERPDASRHVQLVCGLSREAMDRLFPEMIATTLDLVLFFEVVETPSGWRVQAIEDASERLVAF